MKINEVVKELNLEVQTNTCNLEKEITGGYASDLLSDVIANSKEGNIWVTLQVHQNIVAVASLKKLSGIILVNSRAPEEETIKKAEGEDIPIMVSQLSTFELIGKLHSLGIR